MSWRGFVPGVGFAACAAPVAGLVGVVAGPYAHAPIAVAVVAFYAAGLVRGPARAAGTFCAIAALGAILHAAGATLGEVGVALAASLGVARSAAALRARPARAALVEGALGLAALALAAWLYAPSAAGIALAVWGFLLVQSAAWLVPGAVARDGHETSSDPFEDVERRVRGLLDGV